MTERPVPPWFRPTLQAPADKVLIIGAGLAGSWLAYELNELGIPATVLDAGAGPATGASGNPAGIVKPFVTRAPSPPGDFYRDAFAHLMLRLQHRDDDGVPLAEACHFQQCGVLQLTETPYPEHADWQVLTPAQANQMAGTEVKSHAIAFLQGGWLNPSTLCQALLDKAGPELHFDTRVHSLERDQTSGSWIADCGDGKRLISPHVVFANGIGMNAFPMTKHIPIVPARGQLSRFRFAAKSSPANPLNCVVSGKHYAMPDRDSVVAGATFQRDDSETALREKDDQSNHDGCLKLLPDMDLAPDSLQSHAGIRATTPDRFPVAGPLPDLDQCRKLYVDIRLGGSLHLLPSMPQENGLWIIGGFGSRGIVSAPWTACSLARQMIGQPLDLTTHQESHFRRTLANRFLIRELMRWDVDTGSRPMGSASIPAAE